MKNERFLGDVFLYNLSSVFIRDDNELTLTASHFLQQLDSEEFLMKAHKNVCTLQSTQDGIYFTDFNIFKSIEDSFEISNKKQKIILERIDSKDFVVLQSQVLFLLVHTNKFAETVVVFIVFDSTTHTANTVRQYYIINENFVTIKKYLKLKS